MADNATPRVWDSIFDVPDGTVVHDREGDPVKVLDQGETYDVYVTDEFTGELVSLDFVCQMRWTDYQDFGPFTEVV